MLGARRGTRSRDSRITPWAKGRRQTTELPRDPQGLTFSESKCYSLFLLGFYLFTRDTEKQGHRRREEQASCWEPDAGLDPGTPGSHPGPKAGAKPLSHPGIPGILLSSGNMSNSSFFVLFLQTHNTFLRLCFL